MNELKKLLEEKKCFKLICGAGNENLHEVEKLVSLYAKAGCRFFDLSANEDVLKAAQKGLDFSIPKEEQKDYHFCMSIGTSGDPHFNKARIDIEKCRFCEKCIEICPQKAVIRCKDAKMRGCVEVIEEYCIGCKRCIKICPQNAVEMKFTYMTTPLRLYTSLPLSCIELHASDTDENEIDEIWQYLNKNFNGMLSICLGRDKLSNEQVLNRIKRLIKDREPYTTVIQADGLPMSGGRDDFKTTLQAIAMAEVIQNANLPVYLMLSGGTNSKTAELANLCGIDYNGIAVGSYARKIMKKYIGREDFLKNECIFAEALKIAEKLILTLGW